MTKQQDPETKQQSLLFQVDYPGIVEGIQPKYRVMAAFEQHIEAPDKAWQYLMFAAEPYETIGFKIPSREVRTCFNNISSQIILIPLLSRWTTLKGNSGTNGIQTPNSSSCSSCLR